MPFSYAQYAGNGSTKTFSVPFPYLLKAHVKLYTGFNILTGAYTSLLVDGADYTWTSTTQVQTTVAPANGVTLTVLRDTPDSTQLVPWQDGSNLVADDMNIADLQNLYVVQEQQDRNDAGITQSTAAMATANAASTAAAGAVSTANAASAAAAGAVSTANAANAASANALGVANTKGDQAINTANAASAAAAGAVSTANAANTAATNAVASAAAANATAASAVTTAGNADVKADAAIAAVASSVNYTAVANVAAIPASPANNTYIEVQNTTGLESFSPLAGRPAGFVGDAGLKARLRYTSSGSTWNWIDYAPSDSDARYLKKTGGTMTGKITLDGAPIAPLHPATKGYVDGNVSALQGDIGTVSTAAAAAQSTANTAVSNAATAQSTANTAVSNAAAAQTTANAALPKAGGTMSGSITFAGGQTFPTSGISAATTSSSGIVQLSDSTSAASSSTAATSAAVKAVQDFAQVVSATANAAMPKAGGVFSGPVTIPFAQAGTGAVTRTVDSKLKDWVSVEDFGAVGNNTANDTAAIQAAITSLSSGGTVYFPAGTYKCDGVLTISNANVRLQGVGREGAKLRFTAIGSNTNAITISANNVTISDLAIQGPQAGTYVANANGIYGNGSSATRLSRIRIEDCEIFNFGSYGIELNFCDNTAVCNNYIHDIGYAGFHLRSGITSLIDGNVVDNITPGTSGNMYGITVSHTSTGYNVGLPANEKAATNHFCIGVNITNNEVTRVAWEAIDTHGGFEINVSNNRIYATRQGIAVSSSSGDATNYAGWSNVIRGNIIDARNKDGTTSGYENLQYGININGYSNANQKNNRRVIVSENIIYGKGIVSGSGSGAIQAFGVERGIISDNIIESWGGTGIVAAVASTLSISGNMIGGAASAGDTIRQCIRWHSGPGELTLTGNTHSPGSLNSAAYGFFSNVACVTYPNGSGLVLASSGNAFMQASNGLAISGAYVSSDAGTNFVHAQLTTSSTAIDISRLTGSVVTVQLSANAAVSVSAITGSSLAGQIVVFRNTSANAITFTRSYAYLSGSTNQTLTNSDDTIVFMNRADNTSWIQISPALANG